MSIYRSRPGRNLWKHVGGDVGHESQHAMGSFDPDDDDRLPPATLDDLGGDWVISGDRRFEVDEIVGIANPIVIESVERPPFGDWERVDEWEVPDREPW